MNFSLTAYAKAYIHPKLTDESSQFIIDKYLFMRKVGFAIVGLAEW